MNHLFLGLAFVFFFLSTAHSADSLDSFLQGYNPEGKEYKLKYSLNSSQNKELFGRYCKGNVYSHKPPEPRYSNALVRRAAKNIAATDRRAKKVLQERALERMEIDMERALEITEELKESTKSQSVKEKSRILNEKIQSENSFDEGMEKRAQSLSKELVAQAKNLVDELVDKLENDLKGINNEVFKDSLNKLHIGLNADLEKVSLAKMKEASESVKAAYETKIGQENSSKIKDLAQKISKEIELSLELDPGNWDFKYMKESVDDLSKEMEENGLSDRARTFMVYTLEFYKEDYDLAHTNDSIIYGKELGQQMIFVRAQYIVDSAKKLSEALAEADQDNDESMTNIRVLSGRLYSDLHTLNPWGDSILVAAYKAFKAENDKFETANILSVSKQAVDKADAEEWENAYQQARSIQYYIERLKDSITEVTYSHHSAMREELAKLESKRIKESSKNIQTELAELSDIESQQMWSLDSFASYMKRDLGLTTAKEAAEKFVRVTSELKVTQELKRLTQTRVEDAKPGMHYYFYGYVWRHYKEDGSKPSNISWNAHKFLKQLCGEYRDRATMIEAKLKWVANNLFILPQKNDLVNTEITAQTKNVWSKVNAGWYYPYLEVTEQLWEARREGQARAIKVGNYLADEGMIDNPVKGTTVCETKFVFAKYVSKGKSFDSLDAFNESYENFKPGCPVADQTDYYDFRGDSNFKHYSPESNGMIWYANNLSKACRSTNRVKSSANNYNSADCEKYFKNPFQMRYAGARSLLASWLFRDSEYDDVFGNSNSMVSIYSHRNPRMAPYSFGFDQNTLDYHFDFNPKWLDLPLKDSWLKGDMGYNEYTGLAAGAAASDEEKSKAFLLISNAVDRHTDWYNSGYNDGNGFIRDQATSPFVASSYVMRSSDTFTSCGVTVQCPPDGLKRWMFVFRVKADNWYGPHRIEKGEAIDFDRHWFDETSFGFTGLADSEHAWDRLGTALEEELDSILYLVNVKEHEGGGLPFEAEDEEGQ